MTTKELITDTINGEIYLITNIKNNKKYIGQTRQGYMVRLKQHFRKAFSCKKDNKFYKAIRKYGKENFTIEVIDKADTIMELNKKEIYWIKYYDSFKKGYNSTKGGDDNPMNYKETREKASERISKAKKGVKLSKERKEESTKYLLEAGCQYEKGSKHPYSKKVIKIGLDFKPIKTYESSRIADIEEFGKESGTIRKHALSKTKEREYFWIYEKDYLVNKEHLNDFFRTKNVNSRSIVQLTLDDVEVKVWNSIREANLYFCGNEKSSINACLAGRCKTGYGYKWKYFEI